jgi:hypothetical protein
MNRKIRRISFVVENCVILGYYTTSSGNSLPTFRDNLTVSSRVNNSWSLKFTPVDCPERSVMNYHYSLCNSPEERSSHALPGGSLKSCDVIVRGFHFTTGAPPSCRSCLELAEFCEILTWLYTWPDTCLHKAVNLQSKLQRTGTWSATVWPPRCLRHRPAVFFHHLRLVVFSIPKGKISGAFEKNDVISIF